MSQEKTTTEDLSIGKLLLGIALTAIFFVAVPVLSAYVGWTSPLSPKGWWVLLIVGGGLVAKMLVGDTANGEFLFYKFGYDNCVMTLGALATAMALQLSTSHDLFPGFSSAGFVPGLGSLSSDPIVVRIIQLFTFFFGALLCTLLTARVCLAIRKGKATDRRGLAFLNTVVGSVVLCLYILMLVAKG